MWASGKKASTASAFESKVLVHLSGAQSIPTGEFTLLELDTEVYDTLGEFDVVNHKFVPEVTGWYTFALGADSQLGAGTRLLQAILRVDGTDTIAAMAGTTADIYTIAHNGRDVYLEAAQEVTVYVHQNSGVNKTIRATDYGTFLSIHRFA